MRPAASASAAPPRLARWLLRRALDGAARSAIVGDLDEEFTCYAVPRLGLRRARRWYWRQAIGSIAACLRGPSTPTDGLDSDVSLRRALMQDRHGLASDLKAALRFTARRPSLSIVVIVTLACGIGANTAVFSILNATFFKKLPVANADRLAMIESKQGGAFTYPEYLESRDAAGFTAVIAGGRSVTTLGEGAGRQRVIVDLVTGNFFEALGAGRPLRGRLFEAGDDRPGSTPLIVISEELWRERFAAADAAVGQTIRVHRGFYTIAGVARRGFRGAQVAYGPDIWMPLTQAPMIDGDPNILGPGTAWLGLMGILDTPDALAAATASLSARWRQNGRDEEAIITPIPRGQQWSRSETDTRFKALSLFVGLILVIACLNVSTLLGANVHARQQELAVRATLGAGRLRLLRQLLAEHLLLALVGGALGTAFGAWLARGISTMMAGRFTPQNLDVSLDRNVLMFTLALSLVSGVAIGLSPAIRWSRVTSLAALRGGPGGLHRMFRARGLWWLIPWQVALGTVLLVSAGMLATTVYRLKLNIDASAPERVWFADLDLADIDPLAGGAAGFSRLQERLRSHLLALPGVEGAALTTLRPLASIRRGPLFVEGMTTPPASKPMPWGPPPPPPPRGAAPPSRLWIVSNSYVTPGFFQALGLPLVRGRDFTHRDIGGGSGGAPRVAIVNETLAERAFGKTNPLGRKVSFAAPDRFDIEIIGVVRDLRYEHLRASAPDGLFFPLAQIPAADALTPRQQPSIDATLVVRARAGAVLTRDAIVQHMLAFDSRLFVDRIWTFDEEAGNSLSQERLLAWLGSILGLTAVTLLVVGLYGAMTAAVTRSRRELGIRLALGASPHSLQRLVVGRSLLVVLAGLLLGLPLSFIATKSFAHLLYGVRPIEPLLGAAIAAVLLVTAAAAALLPARQAARVDPVVALRLD